MSAAASSWSTSLRVPSSSTVSPRWRLRDLLLERLSVRPVAGDREPGGAGLEGGHRVYEGREVLRRPEPAHAQEGHRRARRPGGSLRAVELDAVVDHDRAVGAAGPGADPRLDLAVGDADRGRRERPHGAVGVEVEARGEPLVGLEGPAVDGEEADGDACGDGRQPPEDAGLRAVGVDDGRALAADQPVELDEPEQIAQRVQRAADVAQRQVPHARAAAGVAEEPVAVRGDQDVVLPGQRGKERRHVLLRPAGLRERDQQQNARAGHGRRRIYLPCGTMRIRRSATESIRHLTVYVAEA